MKKWWVLVFCVILSASAFAAKDEGCTDLGYDREMQDSASINTECTEAGYDYAIAKWEWNGKKFVQTEDIKAEFDTKVSGTDSSADWTSIPGVSGIISKEGKCYQDLEGGVGGSVENIRYGISHITLCGNNPGVPEFNTVGIIAVLLAGAALVLIMRK